MPNSATLIALFAASLVTPAGANAATIPWSPSYATAQEAARQSGKLIMVDFYGTGCPACTALDEVYKNPAVVQAASKFVSVRVDYERDGQPLADRYGVYGLPAVLFLDASGTLQGAVPGAEPATDLATDMTTVSERFHELTSLQDQFHSNPNDTDAGAKLALALLDRGRQPEAEAMVPGLEAHGAVATAQLVPLYSKLAESYLHVGNTTVAAGWCRKIISASTDPLQVATAHFNLGVCHQRDGQLSDATTEWNTAAAVPGAPGWIKDKARATLRKVGALPGN